MRHLRRACLLLASVTAVVATSAATVPAVAAGPQARNPAHGGGGGGTSSSSEGYDLSYPQCNGRFPHGGAFGIVGVNAGIVYSPNPCLGTGDGPSELAWAIGTGHPQFYANTADPGPAYSSYWRYDLWQSFPETCTSDDLNSTGCSYDYGWYAAQDSFRDAVAGEQEVTSSSASAATQAAASAPWWLDVETGNSWESQESPYSANLDVAYANDAAALQGAADYLAAQGVTQVGFYSTASQWDQITGGAALSGPDWVAGYADQASAARGCGQVGFSGGAVALTQYRAKGFDADHAC